MLPTALLFLFLSQASAHVVKTPQTATQNATEENLRKRAQDFYALMQKSRYTEAEALVNPEDRERLRSLEKGPFITFTITAVKLEVAKPPKKAQVSVTITAMHPPIPAPMPSSFVTTWVFTRGNWFLEVPKPPPAEVQAAVAPRPPDEVEFQTTLVDIGTIRTGEKGLARFPFKNISGHAITLEVNTHSDRLTVKDFKTQYAPEESGELVVEFDPAKLKDNYGQSITVHTKPGKTDTLVTVTAYIPRS